MVASSRIMLERIVSAIAPTMSASTPDIMLCVCHTESIRSGSCPVAA